MDLRSTPAATTSLSYTVVMELLTSIPCFSLYKTARPVIVSFSFRINTATIALKMTTAAVN